MYSTYMQSAFDLFNLYAEYMMTNVGLDEVELFSNTVKYTKDTNN